MYKSPWAYLIGSLTLVFGLGAGGCVPLSNASRVISQAALVLTDATNAVNIAEAELVALNLSPSEKADADAVIAKARQAIAAADATVAGAKDITDEQLDAALAQFRIAWGDIGRTYAAQTLSNARTAVLPVPLALRHVKAP